VLSCLDGLFCPHLGAEIEMPGTEELSICGKAADVLVITPVFHLRLAFGCVPLSLRLLFQL